MGPARKRYLLGLALGAFELAILFSMPYINQELIDIVTGASQGDIMATLFWMLAVFLLFVPPVVYGKYLQAISTAQGTVRLRKLLFGHILHMPNGAMARYKIGDYITRLTSDAEGAMAVFNTFLVVNLIRFAVIFPITLVMLLLGDWHIAVAGVLYSGINMGLSLYLNPLAKRLERGAKEEIAGSASFLIEALRSIPVIRVFALQAALAGRYRAACGVIREKRMKSQTVMGITYGTVDFFAQSAQAVGFILGIVLAGNQVTLGKAVFHATLMSMMADSVFRLSTFLLLSQSTPLIFMGDEFGNSQKGNNNPYCQDNAVTWLNWGDMKKNSRILDFWKMLAAFRKSHPILRPSRELRLTDYIACGYPDLSYHGQNAWCPQTEDPFRYAGIMLCGKYARDGEVSDDSFLYIAANMHWEGRGIALPRPPRGMRWEKAFTTEAGERAGNRAAEGEDELHRFAPPRSVTVYISSEL